VSDCTVNKLAKAYKAARIVEDCAVNTLEVDRKGCVALGAMGVKRLSQLRMKRILKHQELRKQQGVSICTLNAETAALKRMLKWGIANGVCAETAELKRVVNSKRLRDKHEPQRRAFKIEKVRSLLEHTPAQWLPLFQLYLCTGLRRAEALELPWSEVGDNVINLPGERTKTGVGRAVLLGPRMAAMLAARPRAGEYVFPNPSTGKPYDLPAPGDAMKAAAKKAGWSDLDGLSPQTLRRTFASIAYTESGKDELLVGVLLGHKHKGKTLAGDAYIQVDEEELRPCVAKVERVMLGNPTYP
jgi:integrase